MSFRKLMIINLLFSAFFLYIPAGLTETNIALSNYSIVLDLKKLSFNDNEPVILNISVINKTDKTQLVNMYDSIYTTFQPIVFDNGGKEAELLVDYRLRNEKMNDIISKLKPRVIELANNEIFTYAVDLKKIYNLNNAQEYRVKAFFYPEAGNSLRILSDNELRFDIFNTTVKTVYDEKIKEIRDVSPSEVIVLMLNAEKECNWENYFKYIKLDSIIRAYPDYVRIYNNADDIKKQTILNDFKNYLKQKRSDYILEYKITNELVFSNNVFVDALVKRFGSKSPFIYKYRYTMEKFDSLWLVSDVEATVIKGRNI